MQTQPVQQGVPQLVSANLQLLPNVQQQVQSKPAIIRTNSHGTNQNKQTNQASVQSNVQQIVNQVGQQSQQVVQYHGDQQRVATQQQSQQQLIPQARPTLPRLLQRQKSSAQSPQNAVVGNITSSSSARPLPMTSPAMQQRQMQQIQPVQRVQHLHVQQVELNQQNGAIGEASNVSCEIKSVIQTSNVAQGSPASITGCVGIRKLQPTPKRKMELLEKKQIPQTYVLNKGGPITIQSNPVQKMPVQYPAKKSKNRSANIASQPNVTQQNNVVHQSVQTQPQIAVVSLKPGQSIGHQPGNNPVRVQYLTTALLTKQINQMQQQQQVVQLAIQNPTQQVTNQVGMKQQQQLIPVTQQQQLQAQHTQGQALPRIILQSQVLPTQQVQQATELQAQQMQLQAQQQQHLQQAQQEAQLQAHQEAQQQAQQQAQLQAQQQAHLQVQQQMPIQVQQQIGQLLQQPQQLQLQSQPMAKVMSQGVVQFTQTQILKNVQNSPNSDMQKVAQIRPVITSEQQVIFQNESKPRVVQTYSNPQFRRTVGEIQVQQVPQQTIYQLPQGSRVLCINNKHQDLLQKITTIPGRMVAHPQPNGKVSLIYQQFDQTPQVHEIQSVQQIQHVQQLQQIQHVTQVQQIQQSQQLQQVPQMLQVQPIQQVQQMQQVQQLNHVDENTQRVEEDQVTVYDGVTVQDEFPTGVLQECFVSETGEVVFADNTTVETNSQVEDTSGSSEVVTQQSTGPKQSNEIENVPTTSAADVKAELVKIAPGTTALCPHCGILSALLNKCSRCQRALPENCKLFHDNTMNHKKNKPIQQPLSSIVSTQNASTMLIKGLVIPSEKLAGKNNLRALQPLVGSVSNLEVRRKRCSTPRKPRSKVPEEPEILTLSSDDEEKQEKKSERESHILGNGFSKELNAEAKAFEAAGIQDSNMGETRKLSSVVEGGGLLEQAIEGSMAPPYALIQCRTVRIGTYKAKPSERVVLSHQGLELKIPLPTGQEVVATVPICDISRALVSYCRSMQVIYIYLLGSGGARVRETLRMTDPKSLYYFDPDSSDESHKRITLIPEKINEDIKMSVKKIFEFHKKILSEIPRHVANEILVKSSSSESALGARHGLPTQEIQTIMVYPPPPTKGGISINTEDYACLGEDLFLNDVIIDFYLKYLMQSVLSEQDRERTHVFSSFFYKRLTSRPKGKGRKHPIEDDPKLTPAEKRHARVKTWTKNVNLFSKDFIIIPINENCHWFLAIICFPGQDGCLRMSDNTPVDMPKPQPQPVPPRISVAAVAAAAAAATTHSKLKVKDNVMSIGSTTITPVKAPAAATITLDHNGEDGSDRDEAEGDEEEMEENSSDEEEPGPADEDRKEADTNSKKGPSTSEPNTASSSYSPVLLKKGKLLQRDGIKQPCILIFDSLVGAPRYRVAATLREYLSIEHKVKQGKVKEFTKDKIKGMLPKVPQQTNFTDCGLYLLQYVEMFFKDPVRDYHAPIKQLVNWFSEEVVSRKREEIVNLIHDLMKEQNIDPSTLLLPPMEFKKAQQQLAEDEEARARLAEAEAEADVAEKLEIAKRQLAEEILKEQSCSEEAMDQDVDIGTEEVVAQTAEESTPAHSVTESVEENNVKETETSDGVSGSKNCQQKTSSSANHSLVDYSESSSDSSCDPSLVKRTQSGIDEEDAVTKKKRKAE